MFGEKLFQTKLLSRLSHKVCRLLSSPVLLRKFTIQAGVVQTLDSAIHRINIYPLDSAVVFPNTYPLDSDLSDG